jgi:hypothetical protein
MTTHEDLYLYREVLIQLVLDGVEHESSQSSWRLVLHTTDDKFITVGEGIAFWDPPRRQWNGPVGSDYDRAVAKADELGLEPMK